MNKLSLKEIGKLDVKDLGKLFKNIKNKEIDYNLEESTKKKVNKKGKQVVAIDIGANSIKLVEGKFEKNILKIDKLMKVETPEGSFIDGKIINEDIIADAINIAMGISNIKAKNVIFTTNSSTIINREIIIPQVTKEEMETVIKYEIQQYLPINLDDYILQYLIIDEVLVDGSKKLKVNVTSFPEKMAYSYYEVINKLGLNPIALDVNYNAINKLVNYLNEKNTNEDGSVAFVDMGATSINISIFKNEKLTFTRMIRVGGDIIDKNIKDELDISIKATESMKIKDSNLLDAEDNLNIAVKNSVDELLEEVERIIKFYNNKLSEEINKIYIYGGTSKLNNLVAYINEKSEMNVEILDLSKDIKYSEDTEDEDIEEYLNAIGSIIRL